MKYPDCYLHVYECQSGQTWIIPLTARAKLDLEHQVKRWIRREFRSELRLDDELMPRLEGAYYAQIITGGRSPGSGICWESGGFYLKENN